MQSSVAITVFNSTLAGDVEGLQSVFNNEGISGEESPDMFGETDDVGRNALFFACMLGRSCIIQELVKNGGQVNSITARGYTPLHCAAMWGQLDTLKTLVELNANLQAVNFRGERAADVAIRYSKLDCAEYLAWIEAKQSLQACIGHFKDALTDPGKIQGKLTKDEKNICTNALSAKSDWLQSVKNPTAEDFSEQRKQLVDLVAPILERLNPLCE
ncbi:ankyrin repeat domain-containing protein 45 [Chanos chanos]|uniref:Ankyrin repeat domain-containing protein 45 n=1 Tax=Chanos chanos TaxID=29144 RepID=A0A6J2VDW6_CHACN|nr:ankyrin repeat domain-containing protein 45 [Chanos chanos]